MGRAPGTRAFIAVGSNIEPERNVLLALELLMRRVRVVAASTFYRTEPLGRPEQASFVNGAWEVRAERDARELKFGVLRPIEAELGRVRTADRYAARPIDLDIAVYGDLLIREPDLMVPDPDILERPFLAIPVLELAPEIRLPGTEMALKDFPVARGTAGLEPAAELTELLRERLNEY
jgi:2-amino-4-hydroxy-6-hydroxymethyldihydropteridine diphosphokinase